MELYTQDQALDMIVGKKGTKRRDKMERDFDNFLIGEAVRKARAEQHLTQEELGERIGVRPARISKIERGNVISYTTLVRIFKALGAKSGTLDLGEMGRVALW